MTCVLTRNNYFKFEVDPSVIVIEIQFYFTRTLTSNLDLDADARLCRIALHKLRIVVLNIENILS